MRISNKYVRYYKLYIQNYKFRLSQCKAYAIRNGCEETKQRYYQSNIKLDHTWSKFVSFGIYSRYAHSPYYTPGIASFSIEEFKILASKYHQRWSDHVKFSPYIPIEFYDKNPQYIIYNYDIVYRYRCRQI